jgi:hypothetical protein
MASDTPTSSEGGAQTQAIPTGSSGSEGKFLSPAEVRSSLARLRTLCVAPGNCKAELDALAEALRRSGYVQELAEVVVDALDSPDANPHVGVLWMRRLTTSKSWRRAYPEELDELCERGEIGRGAVIELLAYAALKGRWNLIKPVLKRHGGWLREDPVGWRLMARALNSAGAYRASLSWISNRAVTTDTPLEIRFEIARALRGLGKETRAHSTVAAAVQNPEAASRFPLLLLWFSLEAALQRDYAGAATEFEKLSSAAWDDDTSCLYYLARGLIRVGLAPRDRLDSAYWSAYERIRDRFRRIPPYKRPWEVRRAYRRVMVRMAVTSGHWGKALIAPWQAADSWTTLLLLAIIPGLQIFAPLYAYRCATHRQAAVNR